MGRGVSSWIRRSRVLRTSKPGRWRQRTSSTTMCGGFTSRVHSAGAGRAAENIAYGYDSFPKTLSQWIDSAGHRRNLLLHGASRVGVASVKSATTGRTSQVDDRYEASSCCKAKSSHKGNLPLEVSEYLPLMQGFSSPPSGLAHFAKASCCQRSRLSVPAVFQAIISTSLRSVRRSAALQRFKSITAACGAERTSPIRASCVGGDGLNRQTITFSGISCRRLAQPCRSPVTRQITSPTSSATRIEPSGPSVTPTGRP
jgi:hypothetical protein